jgi:hypothetical protein
MKLQWQVTLLGLTGIVSELFAHNISLMVGMIPGYLGIGAPFAILVCMCAHLLLKGHWLGFGWEGLFTFLHTNIYTAPIPPSIPEVLVRSHKFRFAGAGLLAGLRHSRYYTALDEWDPIISWLRNPEGEKNTPNITLKLPQQKTLKKNDYWSGLFPRQL